jgi:hypothetical protein
MFDVARLDNDFPHNLLVTVTGGVTASVYVDQTAATGVAPFSTPFVDCNNGSDANCRLFLGQSTNSTSPSFLAATFGLARVFPRHALPLVMMNPVDLLMFFKNTTHAAIAEQNQGRS